MPKKWDDVPDGRRQTGAKSLGNRHFLLVEPLAVTGVSIQCLATRIYSATRLLLEEQTDEPVLVVGR